MQRELTRLRENGVQCGLGAFGAPTPGQRHRRVRIGADHQAVLPNLDFGSKERGDTLVQIELVHVPCLAVVLNPSKKRQSECDARSDTSVTQLVSSDSEEDFGSRFKKYG